MRAVEVAGPRMGRVAVVGRSNELTGAKVEPVARVGLSADGQQRGSVLERQADDLAAAGRDLFDHIADRRREQPGGTTGAFRLLLVFALRLVLLGRWGKRIDRLVPLFGGARDCGAGRPIPPLVA